MKVIVAGSRSIDDPGAVRAAIESAGFLIHELVSGGAKGVDLAAEELARQNAVTVTRFPYRSELGRAGGPVRNAEMADYADGLIAIWDGVSRGTRDMIQKMRDAGKPLCVVRMPGREQAAEAAANLAKNSDFIPGFTIGPGISWENIGPTFGFGKYREYDVKVSADGRSVTYSPCPPSTSNS